MSPYERLMPALPAQTIGEHQRRRRVWISLTGIARRAMREGMVYTRAGVLDMTRRRARRQPQAEQILLDTRDAVTDNA